MPKRPTSLADWPMSEATRKANTQLLKTEDVIKPAVVTKVVAFEDTREKNGRLSMTLTHDMKSLNHFKKQAQRQEERRLLEIAIFESIGKVLSPPFVKQHVTITRILGPNQRSYDDLGESFGGGSVKQLVDAMKRLGFWIDDSPKWLERSYAEDKTRRKFGPAVLVEIKRVKNG